jgi:hypothetical protein
MYHVYRVCMQCVQLTIVYSVQDYLHCGLVCYHCVLTNSLFYYVCYHCVLTNSLFYYVCYHCVLTNSLFYYVYCLLA